jgi:tRNA A37 threonylcarbamoyladenosine modification protein TsaB
MLDLLLSLTSRFVFLTLLKNKKCLESICQDNFRQHSENFLFFLQKILKKTKYSLADIEKIYFTSLPGSQTGYRISLTFGLTLQVLNPQVKLYHLNSLLFQVGESKAISLISVDQKKTKYHVSVYQETKCLLKPQVIESIKIIKIQKKFPNYLIYEDFCLKAGDSSSQNSQPINFWFNFQRLLPKLQLFDPQLIE